jgi:hypothetical protein
LKTMRFANLTSALPGLHEPPDMTSFLKTKCHW